MTYSNHFLIITYFFIFSITYISQTSINVILMPSAPSSRTFPRQNSEWFLCNYRIWITGSWTTGSSTAGSSTTGSSTAGS